MNAILLMLSLTLGVTENTETNKELLISLEAEKVLFASIEEITTEKVLLFDDNGNQLDAFTLDQLIENDLSFKQSSEIMNADLMLEYQGNLYYLKG